jgi:hypothetical protein
MSIVKEICPTAACEKQIKRGIRQIKGEAYGKVKL